MCDGVGRPKAMNEDRKIGLLDENIDMDFAEYNRAVNRMAREYERVERMEDILSAKYGVNWDRRYKTWLDESCIKDIWNASS